MERIKSYLSIAAVAVPVFVIAALLATYSRQLPAPIAPVVATSTLAVVPAATSTGVSLPDIPLIAYPSTSTTPEVPIATVATTVPSVPKVATTTPKKAAPVVPTAVVKKPLPAPPALVSAPVSATPGVGHDATAATLRSAMVNILCMAPVGSGLHSISGSGVFIDPKGIILTNSHIAQYLLFPDRGVVCRIRTGSPATEQYGAGLLYISPKWIQQNASLLNDPSPTGTGEYDFALIGVTRSVTTTPLPATFPSIALGSQQVVAGTPVVIGSYGAQFLDSAQVRSDLFPTLVFGSVKDIFTFNTNTVDILSLGGSAAAQEGSSGGGIASPTGELIGTITTSTMEGDTSTRELHAITASYIRAEYAHETGSQIDTLLSSQPIVSMSAFASQADGLETILKAQLH